MAKHINDAFMAEAVTSYSCLSTVENEHRIPELEVTENCLTLVIINIIDYWFVCLSSNILSLSFCSSKYHFKIDWQDNRVRVFNSKYCKIEKQKIVILIQAGIGQSIACLFVKLFPKNLLACLPVLKLSGKLGPTEGELNILTFVERQFPNVIQLDVCKLTTCLL